MRKLTATVLLSFALTSAFCQSQHKVSAYLQGQYNKTIYDMTVGNNPWGVGLGIQLFIHNLSQFKPLVDCTIDAYPEDDKVLRLNSDGTPVNDVNGMVNLFAGLSYHPAKRVYLSLVAGPSMTGGQTLLGLKPSLGFYFSQYQKWTGKVSYINVFDRDTKTKEDFGSLSVSLGVKLF